MASVGGSIGAPFESLAAAGGVAAGLFDSSAGEVLLGTASAGGLSFSGSPPALSEIGSVSGGAFPSGSSASPGAGPSSSSIPSVATSSTLLATGTGALKNAIDKALNRIQITAVTIVIRVNVSPALAPKALWPPMPPNAPVNPPPRPCCTKINRIMNNDDRANKTAMNVMANVDCASIKDMQKT
jgi:hypothetical protein